MVTFTLPFELRVIAKHQPELMYQAMFSVAASVLKDFAKNSKQLGGDIGFTGVLHTHNRRRPFFHKRHPHIHFIIPAGSFDKDRKQWHKSKGKYLFNAFNLATVWRERLPALKYLSRYLYRGVLPDTSIIGTTDEQVSFEYLDSQTQTSKVRMLPAVEFLWLVLQHVLPKGLRRVRDYGLLRGRCRKLI
jgi:hypothetical protein